MIATTDLGWDAGWDQAFEPFAAAGRRPARVVAVHTETAIVRGKLAHAERLEDPRARAAEAKRWRQIHKDVGRHMDHEYGRER